MFSIHLHLLPFLADLELKWFIFEWGVLINDTLLEGLFLIEEKNFARSKEGIFVFQVGYIFKFNGLRIVLTKNPFLFRKFFEIFLSSWLNEEKTVTVAACYFLKEFFYAFPFYLQKLQVIFYVTTHYMYVSDD